jgi:hypothetical protein
MLFTPQHSVTERKRDIQRMSLHSQHKTWGRLIEGSQVTLVILKATALQLPSLLAITAPPSPLQPAAARRRRCAARLPACVRLSPEVVAAAVPCLLAMGCWCWCWWQPHPHQQSRWRTLGASAWHSAAWHRAV